MEEVDRIDQEPVRKLRGERARLNRVFQSAREAAEQSENDASMAAALQAKESLPLAEEFSSAPDVDGALDFYNELVEFVRGRIRKAEGLGDLNRGLRELLAGLW